MSMITLQNLRYGYSPSSPHSIDALELRPGALFFLVGLNGSGKSTVLRVLAGVLKPFSGRVEFKGTPQDKFSSLEWAQRVGWSTSAVVPFFRFSVQDVVKMGKYPYGGFKVSDESFLRQALAIFQLEALVDVPFDQLSSGQQQRVLLAKTWLQNPDVFLLDEPFDHLDIPHQKRLKDAIVALKQAGKTVVLVSHRLEDGWDIADSVLVAKDSCVKDLGTTKSLSKETFFED
jgi:iron complex transport system ATP-binding protein